MFDALIGTDGREHTPFGPGLANMPALHVAGEHDRRLAGKNLASVNMTQGPVVIASKSKFLERAGGIPLVAVHAAHAGVEQADVDVADLGRRIGGGQVLRDGGLGEALPVDGHAQVLELHSLGTFVGQDADIFRQSQRSCHLVGGVVVAGDDEDGDLLVPQPAELPRDQKKPGVVIAPIAVVEVARDQNEIERVFRSPGRSTA